MLASHMESNGQTWPNRLGDIVDASAAFNYGFSDLMMNNLWVYDFNILEESQNQHNSGFPEHISSEFTVTDPAVSSVRSLIDDIQQNRENGDPNSIKITEIIEPKVIQKRIKGPRSRRCKRTVFESPWNLTSTPSMDLYGSVDNQGSAMSKKTLANDVNEPTSKRQKGYHDLKNNYLISESVSVNGVGTWLEDVGFGRYAGVFEMHEVDEEALPLLTLDDLKEMGVLAVGPRRKLYAAICRLRGN